MGALWRGIRWVILIATTGAALLGGSQYLTATPPGSVIGLQTMQLRPALGLGDDEGAAAWHPLLFDRVSAAAAFIDGGGLRRARAHVEDALSKERAHLRATEEVSGESDRAESESYLRFGETTILLGRLNRLESRLRHLCDVAARLTFDPSGTGADPIAPDTWSEFLSVCLWAHGEIVSLGDMKVFDEGWRATAERLVEGQNELQEHWDLSADRRLWRGVGTDQIRTSPSSPPISSSEINELGRRMFESLEAGRSSNDATGFAAPSELPVITPPSKWATDGR